MSDKPGEANKGGNRIAFDDPVLKKIPLTESGRKLYWDAGRRGLYLLVSNRSAVFRSKFKVGGKWATRKLAGYLDVVGHDDDGNPILADVEWARAQAKNDKHLTDKGIDPREKAKAELEEEIAAREAAEREAASRLTFEAIVDQFITDRIEPNRKTWKQTESTIKKNCATWLALPFADITKRDARDLLRGVKTSGRGRTASLLKTELFTLWRWAAAEDIVPANIIQDLTVDYERQAKRRYSDDEVKAIWNAAGKLDVVEGSYIKLCLLLVPRKSELKGMRWSEIGDVTVQRRHEPEQTLRVWRTPHERTKTKKSVEPETRQYLTPLPALAQRILKSIPKRHDELVFPSGVKKDTPISPTGPLTAKLIRHGAPSDFGYHAFRHTATSWFQDQGYGEDERGTILNHGGRTVTSRYSHGNSLILKLTMLEEWAEHVEALVTPKGAALLR